MEDDIEVVGEAGTAEQAVSRILDTEPDVAIRTLAELPGALARRQMLDLARGKRAGVDGLFPFSQVRAVAPARAADVRRR